MSNYNSLKTTINANVKQNGRQEITGQILNSVLNAMVNTLGAGYQFAGVATTATGPGSPDAKVFYIANGKGTYTNFGGVEVTEDDVVVLYWDSSWHKVSTGIASQEKLTELESKVDAITTEEGRDGVLSPIRVYEGRYLKSDATIGNNSIYGVFVFKVYKNKTYTINEWRATAAIAAHCFFSLTDELISSNLSRILTSSTTRVNGTYTPTEDGYLFLSCDRLTDFTPTSHNYTDGVRGYLEETKVKGMSDLVASLATKANTTDVNASIATLNGRIDNVSEQARALYDFGVQDALATISGYYINSSGAWVTNASNKVRYWAVKKGEIWRFVGGTTSVYAAWSFFSSIPSVSARPTYFQPYNTEEDQYFFAREDGYVAVSAYMDLQRGYKGYVKEFTLVSSILNSQSLFDDIGHYIDKGTGSRYTNANYVCTDFIKIDRKSPITISGVTATGGCAGIAFYTASKTFISSANISAGSIVVFALADIPSNAEYIRCASTIAGLSNDVQVLYDTWLEVSRKVNTLYGLSNELTGKTWISLGDSITYRGQYQTFLSALVGGFGAINNKGVSGSYGRHFIYEKLSDGTRDMNNLLEPSLLNSYDLITFGSFANDYEYGSPLGTINDSIGTEEVDTLSLSVGSVSAGTITISLNGVSTTIDIVANATMSDVLNAISAKVFSNWEVSTNVESGVVTFSKRINGTNVAPTFSGGTTGITGTFVVTTAGVAMANTYYAQMKSVCKYLTKYCPSVLKIAFSNMQFMYGVNNDFSRVNSRGNTIYEYRDAMRACCELYGIPFVDMMSISGVDNDNKFTFYSSSDTVHPNASIGMKRMAYCLYQEVVKWIPLIKNIL